jgi:hypothetical protein
MFQFYVFQGNGFGLKLNIGLTFLSSKKYSDRLPIEIDEILCAQYFFLLSMNEVITSYERS